MTRSERFKPVQRISEDREQKAARELGDSRQQLDAHKHKLGELERYLSDYYRQYQQAGSIGLTAAKLQELQRFLATLNGAIKQQQNMVAMAEQNCAQKEALWLQARSKSLAVDKVAERLGEDERLQRERREQRESDEFAQRSQRHKL